MSKSKIEWTDETWNPVVGCSIVSPGCHNCYAMAHAARLEHKIGNTKYAGTTTKDGRWTGLVSHFEDALMIPLRRKKPTVYFVNSMSDLFHPSVPEIFIDRVYAAMFLADQHFFQILTKRAERMQEYLSAPHREERVYEAIEWLADRAGIADYLFDGLPLPGVALGVSIEDVERRDERLDPLLDTPAAIRWISAEPLLEKVDFGFRIWNHRYDHGGVDWVVIGGESGPIQKVRPFQLRWLRSMLEDSEAGGVPAYVKQLGRRCYNATTAYFDQELLPVDLKHPRGGDPKEWPAWANVREYPSAMHAWMSRHQVFLDSSGEAERTMKKKK